MKLKCMLTTKRYWIPGKEYACQEVMAGGTSLAVCDEDSDNLIFIAQPYRHDSMGSHYRVQTIGEYGVQTLATFVLLPQA